MLVLLVLLSSRPSTLVVQFPLLLPQFYKYAEHDIGGIGGKKLKMLHQSTTMSLHLEEGTTAAVAQKAALSVVAVVKHILEEQRVCADSIPEVKRQRDA